jgi:hypothetical protein
MRRVARERAEASDWERVLPGLLDHYRLLLGRDAPEAVPARAALEAAPTGEPR